MASGFIGQVSMKGTGELSGDTDSTSSLSYSAPSSVSYSVVSISESASISSESTGEGYVQGFCVSSAKNNTDTATSNDIRLILGPNESVTISGELKMASNNLDVAYSYTGSMSVLEVN